MATADHIASTLTTEQINRFWSYVSKAEGAGCWLWTRGKTKAGYGVFHPSHGVSCNAHRLSWLLTHGPIAEGLEVCHNCPGGDNPACCNPFHLWLGTHAQNLRDAFAKGRMADRDESPVCKGSRHGMSALVEADVVALRAAYAAGGVSTRELARRYGVSQATLWAIIKRKTWAHVGG